jgi:site-specific DNA-adenine methylase/DNA modification methylase
MSRSPHLFPYPGAKRHLQEHIVPKLHEQLRDSAITTYAEPFFGAGGIGLALLGSQPPIEKVVINDRDCGVASTWTSVIRYPDELIERVEAFTPTVEAYHKLNDFLMRKKTVPGHESVVDLGFANLALHRISFRGKGTRAGSPQGGAQCGKKTDIAAIWNPQTLVGLIRQYNELFASFEIDGNCCHSFDFQRILETDERMLVYLDPPHYHTGANFYHIAFTADDHYRLAAYLRQTHHKWMVSYDDSQVIRKLYAWANIETITVNYRGFDPRDIREILITPKQAPVSVSKPNSWKPRTEDSQEVPQQVQAANSHDARPACQRLPISAIRLDEELHARVDMRQDVVEEYAERMRDGAHFPPVTVFCDGSTSWLSDGWHRLAAALHNEMTDVEAQVYHGTRDEALLHAAGSNATHGLRRTNADKRRAVMLLLAHPAFSAWSDRELARRALVSHDFVSRMRHSLSSDDSDRARRKYRDRHGNSSTMNTSHIGGRGRPRPQSTFQTAQVFDHVRQLIRSYELAFPGLEVEYQTKQNTVTIRVTKSKKSASSQATVEHIQEPLEALLNQVINENCQEVLPTIPSNSIPLVITDVPMFDDFYVEEHPHDEASYLDYLDWLRAVFTELYRMGTSDARYCLNIQGTNGSARCSYTDIVQLARQVGLQFRSEITWYTPVFQRSALSNSGSVTSPHLANAVERIVVLYKHSWEKQRKGPSDNLGSDHMRLTQGLWEIDPDEQQDTSLHLARLPLEIPLNLLRLLSYQDDVVLDPFGSGGTVAVAAQQLGRPFISIEASEHHWEIAKERLGRVA